MRVVIDTNVLISSIGLSSPYRLIFDKIKTHELEIAVSNDILTEYHEIICSKMNSTIADNLMKFFTYSANIIKTDIYYFWELIEIDPSDNKFVDCYLSSNSDYIVTNDKHFDALKLNNFPQVNIINADDFMKVILMN